MNTVNIEKPEKGKNGYVYFGRYPQGANGEVEPIEWRVPERYSDGSVLLISEKILDCVGYHNEEVDITWEKSDIRKWLNADFYNKAFDAQARELIEESECTGNGVDSGNETPSTRDRVFLLNTAEAEKYFQGDGDRQAKGSDYAKNGKLNYNKVGLYAYKGNGVWWLRNRGSVGGSCAACVCDIGAVRGNGGRVFNDNYGARPALRARVD